MTKASSTRPERFGPNGEQVERFLEAAQKLTFDDVAPLSKISNQQELQDPWMRVLHTPRSAARYSAISSAAMKLVRSLRHKYPRPASTAENLVMNGFTLFLRVAVSAFAFRPQLGDEVVGPIIDPFAERLGFEWRSWGVTAETPPGDSPADVKV
jgi:hypothetical protein